MIFLPRGPICDDRFIFTAKPIKMVGRFPRLRYRLFGSVEVTLSFNSGVKVTSPQAGEMARWLEGWYGGNWQAHYTLSGKPELRTVMPASDFNNPRYREFLKKLANNALRGTIDRGRVA